MISFNFIYGLVDPCTWLVRYVGLTRIGLKRARQHRMPSRLRAHSYKNSWIKTLFAKGLDYTIVVLEDGPSDLKAAERFWIAYGRACGWPLTNLTDGGDGANGWRHTADTRAKISTQNKGRKRTPEFKARMSAMKKGRPGRKHTPESKAKIGAANKGRPSTVKPTTRARMSAAWWASEKSRGHLRRVQELNRKRRLDSLGGSERK